jgi:hypothetical protein
MFFQGSDGYGIVAVSSAASHTLSYECMGTPMYARIEIMPLSGLPF